MKAGYFLLVPTLALLSCAGDQETTQETTTTDSTATTEVVEVQEPTTIAKDVEADEFKTLIDGGAGLILDVRTADEFNGGHIANAINIDFYGDGFDATIDTLDKSTPVYVYCQGGGRSGQTKDMMATKGFTEVYNLLGGYGNWPYKE